MCELLAACRRVPIQPPGGSSPALGDPANPTYSVTVSDTEAIGARAKKAAEVEAARLYPTGTASSFLQEAMSTAFEKPAQAVRASLTGRRPSVKEGRPSGESMRVSQDSRRRSSYTQGTYLHTPYR